MKPIRYVLLFVLTAVMLASCSKDWLKPEPLSFFAPENLLVDKKGYEAFMITLRKNLRNTVYGEFNTIVSEGVFSELGVAGPVNNNAIRNMDRQLTPSADGNYYVLANYQWGYRPIRVANTVITRIDDITWDNEQDRNSILGEAFFHRSYWYYLLVHEFGDVPFIGKELMSPRLDFRTHARTAILKKLIEDMEFAVQWMPENTVPGAPCRAAAFHLLTKIYLAAGEFEKAVTAATTVINGKYKLVQQRFGIDASKAYRNYIWDLHRPANIHHAANTETILATLDRFELTADARTSGLYTLRNYTPSWWTRALDSRGSNGTVDNGPQYDSLGRGGAVLRPSPYYTGDIWTDPNDLRRLDGNWIFKEDLKYNNPKSVDFGKPIDPTKMRALADTFQHYFSFPYYIAYVPQGSKDQVPNGGNGDWYIFRLAETYLLRAEAYFWLDDKGAAAEDINAVRRRVHAQDISAGDVTIDYILDERARELFGEEPRKSELTRISYIMAANHYNGYTLENFSTKNYWYDRVMEKNHFYRTHLKWGENECRISPHHVLWPVPAEVINTNTLGVINQNIGYPGADKNQPPLTVITPND
ncbi:RagB/SusD family nutrient uptake outer membrane protein [Chitinophaga cymbidii]|nr:RagB/SusD family nutrient uptake outer membrane protein [Chitinophaga cymbidii]